MIDNILGDRRNYSLNNSKSAELKEQPQKLIHTNNRSKESVAIESEY